MRLVTCTNCGVVFDIDWADNCDGTGHGNDKFCFICPLGHVGHESPEWIKARRRKATAEERKDGIIFMLPDFEVKLR